MTIKYYKGTLLASLLLNVVLIIGLLLHMSYIRSTGFKSAVIITESQTKLLKNILSDIESKDAHRIEALKKRLHQDIEFGEMSSAMWQKIGNL